MNKVRKPKLTVEENSFRDRPALFVEDEDTEVDPEEETGVYSHKKYEAPSIEETDNSEESDSFKAVWVSASEEEERLKEKDYNEALEEAKRLRALNAVSIGSEPLYSSNRKREDKCDDEDVRIAIAKTRTKPKRKESSDMSSRKSWDRFRSGWFKDRKSSQSEKSAPSESANGKNTISQDKQSSKKSVNESRSNASKASRSAKSKDTSSKSRSSGPVDVDNIPETATSQEDSEPTRSVTRSYDKLEKKVVENKPDGNHRVKPDASESTKQSKTKRQLKPLRASSEKQSKAGENSIIPSTGSDSDELKTASKTTRSSSKQYRRSPRETRLHNDPYTPEDSHKSEVDSRMYRDDKGNHRQGEEMISDDDSEDEEDSIPVKEVIPKTSKKRYGKDSRESKRISLREGRDNDTFKTEGDDSFVSNEDIIKAVRGHNDTMDANQKQEVRSGSNLDGLTSWIIAGFDSLANAGLKDPIGFLDWSGEERKIKEMQNASDVEVDARTRQADSLQGGAFIKEANKFDRSTSSGTGTRNKGPEYSSTAASQSHTLNRKKHRGPSVATHDDPRILTTRTQPISKPLPVPTVSQPHEPVVPYPHEPDDILPPPSDLDTQILHSPRGDRDPPARSKKEAPVSDENQHYVRPDVSTLRHSFEEMHRRNQGQAEVQNLLLDTQVNENQNNAAGFQDNANTLEEKQKHLSRHPYKRTRELVSISSIEVPTFTKEQTLNKDDEYSVSILGLRKNKRSHKRKSGRCLLNIQN